MSLDGAARSPQTSTGAFLVFEGVSRRRMLRKRSASCSREVLLESLEVQVIVHF